MAHHRDDLDLVHEALAELATQRRGAPSGAAMTALYRRLYAPIQATVIRVLVSHGAGREVANRRALVQEYVQHIFMSLFVPRPGRILDWDVRRSALPTWVRLHTHGRMRDLLRARNRDPWAAEAVVAEILELHLSEESDEERVALSQLWFLAKKRVLQDQSELGQRMFRYMFEEDLSTHDIRRRTKLSGAAVYTWRHRLRALLQSEITSLMSD